MVRIPDLAWWPKISFLSFALPPSFDLSSRFHNVGSSGFDISKPINWCLSFFVILFLLFLKAIDLHHRVATLNRDDDGFD